jgi:hypothetical protein
LMHNSYKFYLHSNNTVHKLSALIELSYSIT